MVSTAISGMFPREVSAAKHNRLNDKYPEGILALGHVTSPIFDDIGTEASSLKVAAILRSVELSC